MSFFTSSSERRFLTSAAAFFTVAFGLVWLWVLAMPMAFLDPEYPSWRAKQQLLAACDFGDILILGDSRAASGMIPARFPRPTTNLAVGGGEAIEVLSILNRVASCTTPPKQIILSLDAVHFTHPDLFWERTVRFGFVNAKDIEALRQVSQALGDVSVYEIRHTDGLPSRLRDAMYRVQFPPLYFASLVKGGVFIRWFRNQETLDSGLAARGQYFFGTAAGSDIVAADGHLREFRPLPVLDWYFNRVLEHLAAHGIPAVFIAMPMNDATARMVDPAVAASFRNWLAGYEARYPGFRVVGQAMPHWPNRYFGDGFAHLNPAGANSFSSGLGFCFKDATVSEPCVQRLQEAPPSTQNDAQYGWFNDTGSDASAKARPSSKRGS